MTILTSLTSLFSPANAPTGLTSMTSFQTLGERAGFLPDIVYENMITRWFFRTTEAATQSGDHSDDMFIWLWWFGVIWFVGLMGLMIYWVIKYRRRPGKIAPVSTAHNTPLEVAWTVIPTLFLIYIFFQGFFGYMDKIVSPGNAIEMKLTGYKWNWTLVYPNGAESPVSTTLGAKPIMVFYMPAETPIRLRMNSSDVMHAFWVPDFRIKADLLPNRYTNIWFNAKAPGPDAKTLAKTKEEAEARGDVWIEALAGAPYTDHWVFCAEYCGDEHSEMAAVIRVVSDNHWRAFLEFAADGGGVTDPVKIGQRVFQQKCASCHSVDGSMNTGPTWKDLYNKPGHRTNKGDVAVTPDYIRESIAVPAAQIVEGYANNMPAFVLKDKQIEGIIAYMRSISVHTPEGERPVPADAAPAAPASDGTAPAAPQPEAPKPQG